MTNDPTMRVLASEFAIFGPAGRPSDDEAFARDQERIRARQREVQTEDPEQAE